MRFNVFSFLILGCSLKATISFATPVAFTQNQARGISLDSSTTKDTVIINDILLSGNKITKPTIILRELLFKKGDSIAVAYLSQILEQSRKNLLNTSLFNFVTIDTCIVAYGRMNVTIDFIERWYIWPMPFLQLSDRNFNVWWETKDLSKIDYGLFLTWDNFRGRKEKVVLLLRMGYNHTFGLAYKIPYINKKKTIGIGLTGGFSGNHEVPYITEENKQVYYKNKDDFAQQNIFSTFNLIYRRSIFNTHTFQINYNDYRFSDTLLLLNNDFSNQSHMQYFTFYYLFKSDHRDIKAYPLRGYYFDLELVKNGFGLLRNEDIDAAWTHISLRKYGNIHKRWYVAAGMNAKVSTAAFQSYFIEKGLGFGNDFARSYEYYVVDGQNYALLKSNLKYELIPTKVKELKFIPSKKFSIFHYALYLNLLVDGAYVKDRQALKSNDLSNSLQYGFGLGLDFVTYYDKVLRMEYSINKLGESGFFLHFVAPI